MAAAYAATGCLPARRSGAVEAAGFGGGSAAGGTGGASVKSYDGKGAGEGRDGG